MICNKCGAQNPDESKACQACGNAFAQPEAPVIKEEKKKKSSGKLVIAIAAALAALIVIGVLIGVIASAVTSGKDGYVKGEFSVIYDDELEESNILYAGSVIADGIDGRIELTSCATGELAVYTDNDLTLYKVTKKGSERIADDVASVYLSDNGAKLAYIDIDDALYVYDMKKGERQTVSTERSTPYAFSPNGSALMYTEYAALDSEEQADEDAPQFISYVYYKGESKKIVEDGVVFAATDDCKYIYYAVDDAEDGTVVYTTNLKSEKKKIASQVDDMPLFNVDKTQMILKSDGKWYASVKGGEKIRIEGISSSISSLWVANEERTAEKLQNNHFIGYSDGQYVIYKINKKWAAEKLVSGIDSYRISRNGDEIFYSKGDRLFVLGEDEAIQDEVSSFRITSDGSAVYFTSEDDTLYYKQGKKDKKRIADDVMRYYVTHDDHVLYIDEDDMLYSSKNGKTPKVLDEDIKSVSVCHDYAYYFGNTDTATGECSVYISRGKVKFEKTLTGALSSLN